MASGPGDRAVHHKPQRWELAATIGHHAVELERFAEQVGQKPGEARACAQVQLHAGHHRVDGLGVEPRGVARGVDHVRPLEVRKVRSVGGVEADVWVSFARLLHNLVSNKLSLAIAVGPDHEHVAAGRFVGDVLGDVCRVLAVVLGEQRGREQACVVALSPPVVFGEVDRGDVACDGGHGDLTTAKLGEVEVEVTGALTQEKLVAQMLENKKTKASSVPTVLSFQFQHTYTGGKRERVQTSAERRAFIENIKNAKYVQTSRGGQITYHGPGQLVIYPILDLAEFKGLKSKCYVSLLEQCAVETLKEPWIGLNAVTTENTGVWVENRGLRKIGSIGVNLQRSITSHGISINAYPDLSYINDPRVVLCGLDSFQQTSIENEVGKRVDLHRLADTFVGHLAERLGLPVINA
ncbi:hypothetical protein OGAPHI_004092 [Ogataea philodendri]|uniref:lipoyl(octanoyl) transferase n=1 Tax=Ogataea philodendri TaxID=1378263 RepID=A0A9P8P503_9ASCO|nr:uncharacterized protein OGAPHI_004092 [Ogataea philodendri]KAH3665903.1 hypothetical protein OGAPHI_004092 [Ogataea philodendri]